MEISLPVRHKNMRQIPIRARREKADYGWSLVATKGSHRKIEHANPQFVKTAGNTLWEAAARRERRERKPDVKHERNTEQTRSE
jgi:hypothetical protein